MVDGLGLFWVMVGGGGVIVPLGTEIPSIKPCYSIVLASQQ